jgi:hypothetical protein
VVPDDQHDLVAEILEFTQLSQADRVSEMNVRRGGIEALFHAERAALPRADPQPFEKRARWEHFLGRSHEPLVLLRRRESHDGCFCHYSPNVMVPTKRNASVAL